MKRVSLQLNEIESNGFFSSYEAQLWNAFIDNNEFYPEDLHEYYISSRRAAILPEHVDDLLSRLPAECGKLYRETVDARARKDYAKGYRIGYFELDLLDFVYNINANRVMCIVGTVGIGKTTFLSYIFRSLRKQLASLQRYIPIIVSFTPHPSTHLEDGDLCKTIIFDAIRSLECELLLRLNDERKEIETKIEKFKEFQKSGRGDELLELTNFIRNEMEFQHGKFELLFVFDNVDHLDHESVCRVSVVSRALFLACRLAVIVAVRPAAFASHIETDAHRGAFNSFRIHLPPPDLSAYFGRRIGRAFSNSPLLIPIDGKRKTISVPINSAITNIAENVLNNTNTKLILEGISNNSVRKASRAFLNIIQYRNLEPQTLFSTVSTQHSRDLSDSLVDGMMVGHNSFYRDDEFNPVVSNIYCFDHPEYSTDYLAQYRILCLLDLAVHSVDIEKLISWVSAFGYEQQHILHCLRHMLIRGLVASPESDHEMEKIKYIKISISGAYYLTELVSNNRYLWNAIPDVTLNHDLLTVQEETQFIGRMTSILELIGLLGKLEMRQVERIVTNSYIARLLGSISKHGLLQRRVISAARKILRKVHKSNDRNEREIGREFQEKLSHFERDIEQHEFKLRQLLVDLELVESPSQNSTHTMSRQWKDGHQVTMWVPEVLSSARSNIIKVECQIGGGTSANTIFGRLESTSREGRIDVMAELNRSYENPRVYSGLFSIEQNRSPRSLPDVRLTLFADTRPILSSIFRSEAESA